ncbi:MAG TPA: hypothetical protein VF572_05515 [Candidatus Saccharimonadales bacterium]|jgi:hypothetical protein
MPPLNNPQQPYGYPPQPPSQPAGRGPSPGQAGYPPSQPQIPGQAPPQGYGYPQQPAAVPPQYAYPPQPAITPLHTSYAPPPAPAEEGSPYDFFLESKSNPKKASIPKPKSGIGKTLVVALVIFMLLGASAAVLSVIRGSSNDSAAPGLADVVTDQQKIIYISKGAATSVKTTSLKNFSVTAFAATTSAQQQTIDFATKRGVKIDDKALKDIKDTRIDSVLAAAQAASTYDSTYRTTMKELLNEHAVKLQQISSGVTVEADRAILDKNIASAQLLQQMLDIQ